MLVLRPLSIAVLLGAVASPFSGCLRDRCEDTLTYVYYEPVYVQPQDFRDSRPVAEVPRPLKNPGKMYVMGKYLLINELNEGIHVFDNTHPDRPLPIAFWKILGNVDMAMRGSYLYADQYTDLLTIDVRDVQRPKLVSRVQTVFSLHGWVDNKGYIAGYRKTEKTETIPCSDSRFNLPWFRGRDGVWVCGDVIGGFSGGLLPPATGIAGSFARFGQWGDYLYCIDRSRLHSFSLADPLHPHKEHSQTVGWEIETIFPWKNRLFIGSDNAVHIFRLDNPAAPTREAVFSHASGCDPVVCDEEHAYVTLHDGTSCNGRLNQLDVLDIRGLPRVSSVRTYPMKHPKGLAVKDNLLFLCDDGLKIFDKTQPQNLALLSHVRGIDTYDVIALSSKHILVVGKSGLFQYDVSNPRAPSQISGIPIVP